MKIIKQYIRMAILILIITITGSCLIFAQGGGVTLDNTGGKISNKGTIIVKSGQVKNLNDTIRGRVEFIDNYEFGNTFIPNITYNQLIFTGKHGKVVDTTLSLKPLITDDSLVVSDNAVLDVSRTEIHAKAAVDNTSKVYGTSDLRMINEIKSQDIFGNGRFSNLNIDNPQGVDVIRGGGFGVDTKLELSRGELRTNTQNKINIGDSAWIVRHVGASISYAPDFDKNVSVRYVGAGTITTGPEIPTDSSKLVDLSVENTQGLYLATNVTVNRQFSTGTKVYTEPGDTANHVLTITSLNDPIYADAESEVIGSLRRTQMRYDNQPMLFNNKYTYATMLDQATTTGLSEMTMRIKPKTYPRFIPLNTKVERHIEISGLDKTGQPVTSGINFKFGYGWRYTQTDATKDETGNLVLQDLKLQRWTNVDWQDNTTSQLPSSNTAEAWAFSTAESVTEMGDFAIGVSDIAQMLLYSKVMMEGPYRFGSMANDLAIKNLIPKTPPDIYPYNLDPNRAFNVVATVPNDVIDWLVLEFREGGPASPTRYYRTCFLRKDGEIVDLDGTSAVTVSRFGLKSGAYWVAVRHRNHLAVITADSVNIFPTTAKDYVDFTNSQIVMGGASALKPIDFKIDGSILFGMIAGDVNNDGKVDDLDEIMTWDARDQEGYLHFDATMSGIVTTRDMNVAWNNRKRVSNLP